MSGRVVEFGGSAEFFKRRAAGLKDDKPVEAMKFLYRALDLSPEDMEAQVAAASMALADDRPRLAIRLAGQALPAPEAFYVVGLALMRLRFRSPAAVALVGCVQQTDQEPLHTAAMQALMSLRAQEHSDNRQEARARRMEERIRRHQLNHNHPAVIRLSQKGMIRFPESECEGQFAHALWNMQDRKTARLAARLADEPLPLVIHRKKTETCAAPSQLVYLRRKMMEGEYQQVLSAPSLPGAERQYLRAAALVRSGAEKDQYLPILLDMQAMDPEDPAVEWALRLIAQGRDGEIPRLYGVNRAAAAWMTESLLSDEPEKMAVRWGLGNIRACEMAMIAAGKRSDGDRLLRQALTDPCLPEHCRIRIETELEKTENCVGITPGKLWMGRAKEPESRRENGVRYKILRVAIQIAPQELGDALFAAWAVFMRSGMSRHCARDVGGWAAAIALAARDFTGQQHIIAVNESRKMIARSRALYHKMTKEKRR